MQARHPQWSPLIAWLVENGLDADQVCVEARATSDGLRIWIWPIRITRYSPVDTLVHDSSKGSSELSDARSAVPKVRSDTVERSLDPLFGPYIAVLPDNFDAHPLTWLLKSRLGSDLPEISAERALLSILPRFVARELERIATTFFADWRQHPSVLKESTNTGLSTYSSQPGTAVWDFLWAWLNVNTRCIYYRVAPMKSDPDNLTLCPILDFANHSPVHPSTSPLPTKCDIWNIAPRPGQGDDFTLSSPPRVTVARGEELYLRYGYHSNQFLFAEYGFVSLLSLAERCRENSGYGNVNITPVVEDLFASRGRVGERMKTLLKEEGYWGNWTLHLTPGPAHPDYRLISALRLYHTLPLDLTEITTEQEGVLDGWRNLIYGIQDTISAENEVQWKESLVKICMSIEDKADDAILRGTSGEHLELCGLATYSWAGYMKNCLRYLWQEEREVARAVIQSVENGEEI
ncbi:hypothetical protein CC1G_04262 [Coprinopsis cinerea okayama7|uniref:SET domain-containing protein n=1 Tax=Coprinopsis cinerea (strain Okayama-7 / 130 / ATCC MYA-4618 / FGSC 9003) TaxID=240176 RepID=A8NFH2_COPC7|nr:hypothetical protein CC1G_04262 [Coprinopsis cinerea okayama7\|eukprot:XP_001833283.2 hypothetical protein CC1G_04262 [Coprinopsis cinerea okayama7\